MQNWTKLFWPMLRIFSFSMKEEKKNKPKRLAFHCSFQLERQILVLRWMNRFVCVCVCVFVIVFLCVCAFGEWLHDSLHLHNNMYSSWDYFVVWRMLLQNSNVNGDSDDDSDDDEGEDSNWTNAIEKRNEMDWNENVYIWTIRKQMYLYARRDVLLHSPLVYSFAPSLDSVSVAWHMPSRTNDRWRYGVHESACVRSESLWTQAA